MYKNAYYIHQYSYNHPPARLGADMKWMAENGFDALSVVVNEIDLIKNQSGIDHVFNSAKEYGLKIHIVPSRWGGIVAGTPGIQSSFCMENPEDVVYSKDGAPLRHFLWGTMASIHSPKTYAFFCDTLKSVLTRWEFDGIIWDEPKCFNTIDYNPLAMKKRPEDAGLEWDRQQFAGFFDRLGAFVKENFPKVRLSMFVYGDVEDDIFDCCCRIKNLDDIGIDGNPFLPERATDKRRKTLIGNAARFGQKAHAAGKNSLALAENFGLTKEEDKMMDKCLPEILGYGIDHMLAYYYGRNNEDPDENMRIIARHFKNY